MRGCSALVHVEGAVMPVVIVQTPEREAGVPDGAHQLDCFIGLAWLDTGAVHSGIDVEKNSEAAAAPLAHLFFVFHQHGNAHIGELAGDFAHAEGIGTDRWISEEDVRGGTLTSYQQFQRGSTLEIADAPVDQHVQSVAELCGFDVHPPAVCVAAQQGQGALDIGGDEFGIHHERGGKHVFNTGDAVAPVPGEFAEHRFLRGHSAL